MDFFAPMLVLITGALVIGSIFRSFIVNRRLRDNARAWVDVQTRLIDKFGSADEVVRYLESDAGRRLIEGQTSSTGSPHGRVLDSVHLGLLVLLGGLGVLEASSVATDELNTVMHVLGTIAAVLGVGFLASAGVSWYLLRNWGLLSKPAGAAEHAGNESTSDRG